MLKNGRLNSVPDKLTVEEVDFSDRLYAMANATDNEMFFQNEEETKKNQGLTEYNAFPRDGEGIPKATWCPIQRARGAAQDNAFL